MVSFLTFAIQGGHGPHIASKSIVTQEHHHTSKVFRRGNNRPIALGISPAPGVRDITPSSTLEPDGARIPESYVATVAGGALHTSQSEQLPRVILHHTLSSTSVVLGLSLGQCNGCGGVPNPAGGLAVSPAGNIYFADTYNQQVDEVTASGKLELVAGNGVIGDSGDGGAAVSASLAYPSAVALDRAGDIFVGQLGRFTELPSYQLGQPGPLALDGDTGVREISTTGKIKSVVGNGKFCASHNLTKCGLGGPANQFEVGSITDIAVDSSDNLFFSSGAIFMVPSKGGLYFGQEMTGGYVYAIAGDSATGSYTGDARPAVSSGMSVSAFNLDPKSDLFIAENNCINEVPDNNVSQFGHSMLAGDIYTVVGNCNGPAEQAGSGGPATSVFLADPSGVSVDGQGNIFISDSDSQQILELIATTDDVVTVAGNGIQGFLDASPATNAEFSYPMAIAVYQSSGKSESVLVDDKGNDCLRIVGID